MSSLGSTAETLAPDTPVRARSRSPVNAAGALVVLALTASPSAAAPATISASGWPASGYAQENVNRALPVLPLTSLGNKNNKHRTPAEAVRELRDISGLTWAQLARFFGVSRRSVHSWAAGGRLSAANEEAVIEAASLLDELTAPGLSDYELRSELLTRMGTLKASAARDPETDINRPAQTWA